MPRLVQSIPSNGGGIYNGGTLTVTSSTVSGNTSSNGGIFNGGTLTLTLTDSTVSGNTTGNSGGGIWNQGTLTLTNSTVTGNSARVWGGGIANISGATMTLTNSTVGGNSTEISVGGGIRNFGTLTINNSTVSGDTASSDGGGGIYNDPGGPLTLNNSTVSGNTAGAQGGGGIDNTGTLTLTDSTVSGNTANNSAGGGIVNRSALTITNSTVSGNTASSDGGGIWNTGGTLTLTSSTVTGNTAQAGKGGGIRKASGTVNLTNAIIAVNTAATGPDCSGLPTSLGYNLIGDDTNCGFAPVTGDLVNGDPILGPLQDNSGPTFTHALLPESPAIDAGDNAACPETDQRGISRPQGAQCDIGAFEFTGNIPPRAFNQTVTTTGDRPVTIVLTALDQDTGDTLTFIIVYLPASGDLFEGITLTGDKITTGDRVLTGDTVTYSAGLGFAGTDSFGFKANDGTGDGNVAAVTIVVNRPVVKGTVSLEGMPHPLSGARITFLSGDQTIARVFSDPENGSFEIQLTSGIYDVKVEKDGFLPATKIGLGIL